jgi:hypothetical protein
MTVTEFMQQYNPIPVWNDSPETGDYRLYSPQDSSRAWELQQKGHRIASVYEEITEDNLITEQVYLDNDSGAAYHKIGYFVY